MSYDKDLDEYREGELRDELQRRASLRTQGKCDYCGQDSRRPACRFLERHSDERINVQLTDEQKLLDQLAHNVLQLKNIAQGVAVGIVRNTEEKLIALRKLVDAEAERRAKSDAP